MEFLFGILGCIILNWKINKEYPWLHVNKNDGRYLIKKYPEIIAKTKQVFIHKIKDFVLVKSDELFIFLFVSLKMVAYYGNYIMTLTTMYRYKVWESESYANRPVKLDFALTMSAALMGDFIWLPEQTACYHSLQSGMIMSNHPWVKQVTNDIYCYYAGLVMNGKCKPLSLGQRIYLITLILMRALARKDSQFKKDIMKVSLLARLLLPVAYVRLKCERLKDRIKR